MPLINTDFLLLCVLGGLVVLAYIVAINAHGSFRLSISYLAATLLLAGTVFVVVQYVNTGKDSQKSAVLQSSEFARAKAEAERQKAEEAMRVQQQLLEQNKTQSVFASRLNSIIATGTNLSATLINVDVRDAAQELDILIANAAATRSRVNQLKSDFEKVRTEDTAYAASVKLISEANASLVESVQMFTLYYRSEDPAQEELRERVMRQKARIASEKFQKATDLIASGTLR